MEAVIILLRIGTYNTRACDCGGSVGVIARDIADNRIDICGLQEIDVMTGRSGKLDEFKLLAEQSGLRYSFFAKSMDFDGGEYGIGIISRFPIISAEAALLPGRPEVEPRVVIRSVIGVNGQEMNFFNTHLSFECEELRKNQLKQILDMLSTAKGKSVLTGDFNIDSYDEYRNFCDGFHLANNDVAAYETFKSAKPRFNGIDNIIISKSIDLIGTVMIDTKASDHRLLIADVEI